MKAGIFIAILILVEISVAIASCNHNECSKVERIIVDEPFINLKIAGNDSIATDSTDKGEWKYYYFPDSSIVKVFRNNSKQIRAWFKYKNGMRVEGAEVYPTTGQIMGKLNFVNGEIDGQVKYYFEDGRVKSEGLFKNGYWWGEWKNYDKNGKLVTISNYSDDHVETTRKAK